MFFWKNTGSDHESKRQYTDCEFSTEKEISETVSVFFFFLPSFISPEVTSVDMFTTSPWKLFSVCNFISLCLDLFQIITAFLDTVLEDYFVKLLCQSAVFLPTFTNVKRIWTPTFSLKYRFWSNVKNNYCHLPLLSNWFSFKINHIFHTSLNVHICISHK